MLNELNEGAAVGIHEAIERPQIDEAPLSETSSNSAIFDKDGRQSFRQRSFWDNLYPTQHKARSRISTNSSLVNGSGLPFMLLATAALSHSEGTSVGVM